MTKLFGWTPTQIDEMTLANLLIYFGKKQAAGGGIEMGDGDFVRLVERIRRERGLA